jgi:hypothetical protein
MKSTANQKVSQIRVIIMSQLLKKLYEKSKKNGWLKLKFNMLLQRNKKRVKVIHTIFRGAQKRMLIDSWAKIKNKSK